MSVVWPEPSRAPVPQIRSHLVRSLPASSNSSPFKPSLGCFEHYPNLNKHDSTFVKYSKAIGWLGNYDLLSNGMRSEREYGLMGYLPYMIVPFYPLFQERGAQKVERPKADWEVRHLRTMMKEMRLLTDLHRITRRRGHMKRSTSPCQNASGVPVGERLDVSGTS